METEAANHAYARLHEDRPFHDGTFKSWVKDWSPSHPYHYSDGVKIMATARDYNPGDLFTTKVDASPWDEALSPGEEPDQEPDQ
jgi:hypothetical protein